MKKLAILRHAKSSWADPGLSDEERTLNARGHRQLEQLSTWLGTRAYRPDQIFCSTSARTRETYEGINAVIGEPSIEYQRSLYLGEVEDYLDALWSVDDVQSVLIIGHNPTCDELTRYLAKPSSSEIEKLQASHFATATFAGFEFDGKKWGDLGAASCNLVELVRPKDLVSAS